MSVIKQSTELKRSGMVAWGQHERTPVDLNPVHQFMLIPRYSTYKIVYILRWSFLLILWMRCLYLHLFQANSSKLIEWL